LHQPRPLPTRRSSDLVEHMGKLPFAATIKTQQEFGPAFTPELLAQHNVVGQGLGAEMIAEEYEIPRPELDELALRSHQLAHRATDRKSTRLNSSHSQT